MDGRLRSNLRVVVFVADGIEIGIAFDTRFDIDADSDAHGSRYHLYSRDRSESPPALSAGWPQGAPKVWAFDSASAGGAPQERLGRGLDGESIHFRQVAVDSPLSDRIKYAGPWGGSNRIASA